MNEVWELKTFNLDGNEISMVYGVKNQAGVFVPYPKKSVVVPLSELDSSVYDSLVSFAVAKQNADEDPTAPPTQTQLVQAAIAKAKNVGAEIMRQFILENVMLGITQRGLTVHVLQVTNVITNAINSGSLYAAIELIAQINPSDLDPDILSEDRVLEFRNKLETAVNVPLATTWNQAKTW